MVQGWGWGGVIRGGGAATGRSPGEGASGGSEDVAARASDSGRGRRSSARTVASNYQRDCGGGSARSRLGRSQSVSVGLYLSDDH